MRANDGTTQANAARERNAKDKGKTPEERAASKAKADADKNAYKCLVCAARRAPPAPAPPEVSRA